MKKVLGLIISVAGIGLLFFHIYTSAKTQSNDTSFLMPIGLLLGVGGAVFHVVQNGKKKE